MTTDEPAEDPHFKEFLAHIGGESDRGCILITGALLDELLARLLRAQMVDVVDKKEVLERMLSFSGALGSFAVRIDLCFLLGLLSEVEHHDLRKIKDIRNAAAHFDDTHGLSTGFSSPFTKGKCDALKLPTQKFRDTIKDAREIFSSTAGTIASRLRHGIEEARRPTTPAEAFMYAVQFDSGLFITMSTWMVEGRAKKALAELLGRKVMGVPEE